MRTMDRIALIVGLVGAITWGVSMGLPGKHVAMAMIGSFFVGFGGMWILRALK